MRLIKHLFFEQYKNFRILLRNLSSLLLLVLGPLALILLVGYAYSGENLHDIKMGVVSSDYSVIEPAMENFSSFGEIIKYGQIDDCISDLKLQTTHVCLVFSDDFGKVNDDGSRFVSGTITFYFDNSRKPLSTKVVEAMSEYFGVAAKKISIESAKTIFTNIQEFVGYVERKNADLFLLVNESENIKQSLVERHAKLVKMRDEFIPVYEQIRIVQSGLNNVSEELDKSYTKYNQSYSSLDGELELLKKRLERLDGLMPQKEMYVYPQLGRFMLTDNLSFLLQNNISYYELSKYNYSVNLEQGFLNISELPIGNSTGLLINLSELDSLMSLKLSTGAAVKAIDRFEVALIEFHGQGDEYYNYLNYQKKQFDIAVTMIDQVKLMLDSDIAATEEYIAKIDVAVVKVRETQAELNSSMSVFSGFTPGQAEQLISPFLQNYEPLLPDINNVQQAYPGMIAIIIIFISILFANIVTLSELNSKAFYRNLLAPTNRLIYVFGLMISVITIVFFQIFVLLLVGQFSFGVDVFSVFPIVAIVVILLSLLFIVLGMIISILVRAEQSSVLSTTFVALAFFLFSNSVTPIEIMPKLAGVMASLNPYVVATQAFRKILIFQMGLPLLSNELLTLGIYLLVSVIILVILSSKKLKN